MRCVLFGHVFQTLPGQREHAGKTFRVCVHCGLTEQTENER